MKALSMQHCDPASLSADRPLPIPTGTSGQTFVCNTTWTPTSPKDSMQCTCSKFSLSEYELAGFPPPVTQSELTWWRTPSLTLARRTQWPTKETLAMYQVPLPLVPDSVESSTVSANKIRHHLASYPSLSKSSIAPRPSPYCKTRHFRSVPRT
jgi:hypothetical protein